MSPGPGVSTPGKSPPSPPWSPTASARRSANMAVEERELAAQLAGLDALEAAIGKPPSSARRFWLALWPKVAAIAVVLTVWQLLVWSGWRPPWVLAPPSDVPRALGR